jgi:hypothetical protein
MDSCFSALIHGHCVCATRECRPIQTCYLSAPTTWLIFSISKWKQTRKKRKKRNTSQRDQPLNGSHVLRRFMTTSVFDSFAGRPQATKQPAYFLRGRLSCRQDNNFNFFRFSIFSWLPRVTDNFLIPTASKTYMYASGGGPWMKSGADRGLGWLLGCAAGGSPAVAARRPIR